MRKDFLLVDEKGFSALADQIAKGVTTRKGKQTAAASRPVLSFEHITVTSWLPLVKLIHLASLFTASAQVLTVHSMVALFFGGQRSMQKSI